MGFLSETRRRHRAWHDRYGGVVIAGPVGIVALVVSMIIPVTQWKIEEPPAEEPLTITLDMQELPPPEIPQPIAEAFPLVNPQFVELAATQRNSNEDGEEVLMPEEGAESSADEVSETAEADPAASLEDWIPTTSDAAELQIIRSEVDRQTRSLQRRRNDLQAQIQSEQIKSAAREFDLNTDGGSQGQTRLLNVENYPQEKVLPILNRYGITYERRHISPSGGRSFLNAAVTSQGTFTNAPAEGYYEVFVLSGYATAQMAMMEIEALGERGYDPRTTRIREVVFGIVINREGQADLGVVDLKVEKVR